MKNERPRQSTGKRSGQELKLRDLKRSVKIKIIFTRWIVFTRCTPIEIESLKSAILCYLILFSLVPQKTKVPRLSKQDMESRTESAALDKVSGNS